MKKDIGFYYGLGMDMVHQDFPFQSIREKEFQKRIKGMANSWLTVGYKVQVAVAVGIEVAVTVGYKVQVQAAESHSMGTTKYPWFTSPLLPTQIPFSLLGCHLPALSSLGTLKRQ